MNTPTPETSVLEIMPDQQEKILAVVQQNALPQEQALSLQTSFAPLFKEAGALIAQSRGIVVTDASQVAQIKLSREYRLLIRQVRIKGERTRKELKEASLRTGKAIDAMNTILVHTLGDEETRLEEQEKIVERAEQARKDALKASRESALAPFGIDTAFLSLGEMPDATFAQLLENTRAGHEAKLAAARKAEEDKIAAENARLKEEARIRAENERLKQEAVAANAAALAEINRIEKEKAEERAAAAKIKAEADAALAAERAAAQAETARIKAEADAAAKLAADKAKAEREAAEANAAAERAKAAKLKAEADAALAAERAAAQAETARIKAESDAAAKLASDKAKAEREAAELIVAQERAKAAKLEAEAKARADAEQAAIAAEQAAARKAAAAPDKAKIAAFADAIRAVVIPELHADNAGLGKVLWEQRTKFADWIEAKASQL